MAGTTRPPPEVPANRRHPAAISRFDQVERLVHWVNAVLFAIVILTAAALYFEPLVALIGRRALVEQIHVYTGLALPVPIVVAVGGRWGRAFRADLARFNRWTRDDRRWIRTVFKAREFKAPARARLRVGKFNAGQKLNAAFTGGVILVMLLTGVVMRWYKPWPLTWRTGATFVHDWVAIVVVIVIFGHIWMALSDRESLRSMRTGTISRAWAARHAPVWLDELDETRQR